MNTPPSPDPDDAATLGSDVTGLALDDGGFVLYDPSAEDAWIQTDAPVALTDRQ